MGLFTKRHSLLSDLDIHGLVWKTVANTTERLGIVVSSNDKYKVVHQTDNDSLWCIVDTNTPTFVEMTAAGVAAVTSVFGQTGDVTEADANFTKSDVGLGNVQNLKVNLTSTIDPTTSDNTTNGYATGSTWVNTVSDTAFICVDGAGGTWQEIGAGGGGGGVTDHGALTGLNPDDDHPQYLNLSRHDAIGGNPHGITKGTVGLGSVDNTSDLDKPISAATSAALATKADDAVFTSVADGLAPASGGGTSNFLRADGSWNAPPGGGGTGWQPGLGVWTFSSTTTTPADATALGAGNFRFNNATFGSITEIYIHDTPGVGGAATQEIMSSLEDTYVLITDATGTPAVRFQVTTVSNNTGWHTLVVTPLSNSGSLSNTTDYALVAFRAWGGDNTFDDIDAHIADAAQHFAQGDIDHTLLQNIGTNSHAAIDSHIADTSNPHGTTIYTIPTFSLADLNANMSGGPVARFTAETTLPAAGIPGRYAWRTSDKTLHRDSGSAWEVIGPPAGSFAIGVWDFVGSASEAVSTGQFSTNNAAPGSVTSLKIHWLGAYNTGSASMFQSGLGIGVGDRLFFSSPNSSAISGEPSTLCFRVTAEASESAGQVTIPVITEAFNGSVYETALPYTVSLVRAEFASGASLPAQPTSRPGRYFYRTSDKTLHRDSGTAWVQLGGAHEATADPVGTDDVSLGYRPGSIWVNTTSSEVFICESNALGVASWINLSGAGSGTVDTSGTPAANQFARFTDSNSIEGRTTAQTRTDLGLVIGTNVQAWSTQLDEVSGATGTKSAATYLAGDDTYKTVPLAQHSIQVNAGFANLVGDTASPGNNKVYGTNASGVRGWKDDPAGGPGTTIPSGLLSARPAGTEGDYYLATDADETLYYRNATGWVIVNDVIRDTLANQSSYAPADYPGAIYQVTDTDQERIYVSSGTAWVQAKTSSTAVRFTNNNRLLGNISGSAGLAQELTTDQVRSLLNVGTTVKARAATTADVGAIASTTLLGNGDVLDGVTLATNDRILVKNQTTGSENGIYVVQAGADTPPVRASDFATGFSVAGELIVVTEGTVNDNTFWLVTNNGGLDVVGTDALVFEQSALSGVIDAGQITSGTFDDARIAESSVTQHEAAIDHDQLFNFDADEHFPILQSTQASRPAASANTGKMHVSTDTNVLVRSNGASWNSVTTTTADADALNSATTTVNVSSAAAPTVGQLLTATSGTAATWQDPPGGGVLVGTWLLDASFNSTEPAAGEVNFSSQTKASVTSLRLHDTANTGLPSNAIIGSLALEINDYLLFQKHGDASETALYKVTSTPAQASSRTFMTVSHVASQGSATFTALEEWGLLTIKHVKATLPYTRYRNTASGSVTGTAMGNLTVLDWGSTPTNDIRLDLTMTADCTAGTLFEIEFGNTDFVSTSTTPIQGADITANQQVVVSMHAIIETASMHGRYFIVRGRRTGATNVTYTNMYVTLTSVDASTI